MQQGASRYPVRAALGVVRLDAIARRGGERLRRGPARLCFVLHAHVFPVISSILPPAVGARMGRRRSWPQPKGGDVVPRDQAHVAETLPELPLSLRAIVG